MYIVEQQEECINTVFLCCNIGKDLFSLPLLLFLDTDRSNKSTEECFVCKYKTYCYRHTKRSFIIYNWKPKGGGTHFSASFKNGLNKNNHVVIRYTWLIDVIILH